MGFYYLYSLPNIRMIKFRRMSWAGHKALTRKDGRTGPCWGSTREIDRLEILGVDGRITLKWVFKNWNRRYGFY
jgi:hypothetical protein